MSLRARIAILFALNAVFVWFLLSSDASVFPRRYGDPGTTDFIQYWSAHALMVQGGNPYDPIATMTMDRALGRTGSDAFVTWNPPWIVVMLAPILRFSFITSASIWMVLSVMFALATAICTTIAYRGRFVLSPAIMIATFAFHPIASDLWFGQLGLLHAVSIAGFLCAVSRAHFILAGLMLVPLSVKPHLTYLVGVLLAYWMFRERTWRVALGFGVGLGTLVALTLWLYPDSLAQWIEHGRTPPLHWVVASLVGVVRAVIYARTGEVTRWPLFVIPGTTALTLAAWLLAKRPTIDLRVWLPPILALSLFTSPYGWEHDQCQLLVLQVALVALAELNKIDPRVRRRIWLALAAVQIAVLLVYAARLREAQHFFWAGLAMACVWVYGMRQLEVGQNTGLRRVVPE